MIDPKLVASAIVSRLGAEDDHGLMVKYVESVLRRERAETAAECAKIADRSAFNWDKFHDHTARDRRNEAESIASAIRSAFQSTEGR